MLKTKTLKGLMILFLMTLSHQVFAIPAEERAALIALYNSTNGDNWKNNTGWLGEPGTECGWTGELGGRGGWVGVICSGNSITKIHLPLAGLTGNIPPELGQLSQLAELNLKTNQLTGNIPPELGQLSQLRLLYLFNNQLTGSIPLELGRLSQLTGLSLSGNQLTGSIPPELGQLSQLIGLRLEENQLTGSIPPELGQLSQLRFLTLEENQLTGSIPSELGQLSQLEWLTLSRNQLTGNIPPELGQLSKLKELRLNQNCLTTNDAELISFLDSIGVSNWRDQRTDCSTTPTADVHPEPTLATGSFAEPSDTPEQAIPILVNDDPQFHLLDERGGEDWFEFYAEEGVKYTIKLPEHSIGLAINPALALFDEAGNLLETANHNATGKGESINWTATATALFRVRVTNDGAVQKTKLRGVAPSYAYTIDIFLTDKPHQGIIKGFALNACHQAGISRVGIAALLNGASEASVFTHKTGEFGIPIDPGTYKLNANATGYQSGNQGVSVKPDTTSQAQFSLSPTADCTQIPEPFIDPVLLRQQAVSVFDEATGLLIIKDVYAKGQTFYVELQIQGNQFLLTDAIQLPGTLHKTPASYDYKTALVDMPSVFAFGKLNAVQMKNDGNGLFSVTKVK